MMNKPEFERAIDQELTDDKFSIINTVFAYYPGITKDTEIINLYKLIGMPGMMDLWSRAKQIQILAKRIEDIEIELTELEEAMTDLLSGKN